MQKDAIRFLCIGVAAGFVNGLFGAGGGMILVPLLISLCGIEDQRAFATSLAVIFPISVVSAAAYLFQGSLSISGALPYLLGGTLGGWIGGKLLKRVPIRLLHALFGIFILWGGIRNLWS